MQPGLLFCVSPLFLMLAEEVNFSCCIRLQDCPEDLRSLLDILKASGATSGSSK